MSRSRSFCFKHMVFHGDTEALTCTLMHMGKVVTENEVLPGNREEKDGDKSSPTMTPIKHQVLIIYFASAPSARGPVTTHHCSRPSSPVLV